MGTVTSVFVLVIGLCLGPVAYAAPAMSGVYGPFANSTYPKDNHFEDPQSCATCHSLQADEWMGSIHNYSAQSPVFHALDTFSQNAPVAIGPRGQAPAVPLVSANTGKQLLPHPLTNFCSSCHAKQALHETNLLEMNKKTIREPAINRYTQSALSGVNCTVCHSVKGKDPINLPTFGFEGDGLANAAFELLSNKVSQVYFGPTLDPKDQLKEGIHKTNGFGKYDAKNSGLLTSAGFCISCHQVNFVPVPGKAMPYAFPTPDIIRDVKNNVTFPGMGDTKYTTYKGRALRVEQPLGDEYTGSVYNKPGAAYQKLVARRVYTADKISHLQNKTVTCQDCHMSGYGRDEITPPGTYVEAVIADKGRKRKHAYHGFTAVSTPLLSDFPNRDNAEKDSTYGHPKGTDQRRALLLQRAVRLTTDDTPRTVSAKSKKLPIRITLENVGTGHNVPSGFSQERETWLHVRVKDKKGDLVYESGYLTPQVYSKTKKPLESLGELDDLHHFIDPSRFTSTKPARMGKDFNMRPFSKKGLANFKNKFLLFNPTGAEVYQEAFAQFLPVNMDNTRSLKPFEPVTVSYDVSLEQFFKNNPNYQDDFDVEVRLRYRMFPKKFLNTLHRSAQLEQPMIPSNLVTEETMALNTVVDMNTTKFKVALDRDGAVSSEKSCPSPADPLKEEAIGYNKDNQCWVFYYQQYSFATATNKCQALGCRLPSQREYKGLGLDEYVATNDDNKEILYREYWTTDNVRGVDGANHQLTYRFLSGGPIPKNGSGDPKSTTSTKFFQCICDSK